MISLTVPVVNQNLNCAYDRLMELTEMAAENNLSMLVAKTALEQAKQAVLLDYAGREKELGANEAARAAALSDRCAEQVKAVALLEADALGLRGSLDIARLEVERWRANLRLLEVQQSQVEANREEG